MKRRRDQTIRIFNSSSHRTAILAPYQQHQQQQQPQQQRRRSNLVNNKYIPLSAYEENIVDAIVKLEDTNIIISHATVYPGLIAKDAISAAGCSTKVNDAFIASYFYLLQKLCGKSAFLMNMDMVLKFRETLILTKEEEAERSVIKQRKKKEQKQDKEDKKKDEEEEKKAKTKKTKKQRKKEKKKKAEEKEKRETQEKKEEKNWIERENKKEEKFRLQVLGWKRIRELLSYPNDYKITVMAYPSGDGYHWFLVIGNREARCIEIYDSAPAAGARYYKTAVNIMVNFLRIVYEPDNRMTDVGELSKYEIGCKPYKNMWQNAGTQEGNTACGIFTALYARYRCMNLEFDFSDRKDIEYFRKLLLLEIYYARIPYISTNMEEDEWDPVTLARRKPSLITPDYPRIYDTGYFGRRAWEVAVYDGPRGFRITGWVPIHSIWGLLDLDKDDPDNRDKGVEQLLWELKDTSDVTKAIKQSGYLMYWLPRPYTKLGRTDEYDLVRIIGQEINDYKNEKLEKILIPLLSVHDNVIHELIFTELKFTSVDKFLESLGWYPADEIWQRINSNETTNQQKTHASFLLSNPIPPITTITSTTTSSTTDRRTADILQGVLQYTGKEKKNNPDLPEKAVVILLDDDDDEDVQRSKFKV